VTDQRVPFWAKPRFVWLSIAVYIAAHFALRLALGPALGLDDSEQALFAQEWLLNYRYRAPPLFTWLLMAVGEVVGVNVVSISLVRYAFLAAMFAFVHLTARRLIPDLRLAALATWSFTAIYTYGYDHHYNLTHTTALAAALAIAWYAFVRLCETPRLGWYLALGAIGGLGLLAKWNFVMFAAALALACLLRPAYRGLVLTWRILPAGVLAALIAAPSALYALRIGPAPGDDLESTLAGNAAANMPALVQGTLNLLQATLEHPQPFLALAVLVFARPLWRGLRSPAADATVRPDPPFLATVMALSLALHWALVPLAGATAFLARLMQPPLFILSVWLFATVARGRPSAKALNDFAAILLALAALAFAARVVVHERGVQACAHCATAVPFGAIAEGIRAAGFAGQGTILVDGYRLGGNLRVVFPQARIIDPRYPLATWPPARGASQCLLVWRGDARDSGTRRPPRLERFLAGPLAGDPAAPHREGVIGVRRQGAAEVDYFVGYRLYEGPVGDCR